MNRVSKLRKVAKAAGYRLHYNNVSETYSLHGKEDFYGLTLEEAEAKVGG